MRRNRSIAMPLAILAITCMLVTEGLHAQIQTGVNFIKDPSPENRSEYKQYLIYLPLLYYERANYKWPLLVYLHGGGDDKGNLDILISDSLPKKLMTESNLPFIAVAPLCDEAQYWHVEMIKLFIDHIVSSLQIDITRIYLTGISVGGTATWLTAIEYPELFAAIVPVCGSAPLNLEGIADQLVRLPIWVFHGAKDYTVLPKFSLQIVNTLVVIGGDVKLTLYPDLGHECWDKTYSTSALFEWLLQQHR